MLPNTQVEFAMKDGLGCNAGHYLPAEMLGKIVPDEHIHEHATCFNVKDRGLVVISSCGHVGIVNSVRQAQEVSGVQKIHAIVGGFHLGPAPDDYLNQVVAEIKKLEPDVVIPMHCSGDNFARAVRAADAGQASGLDHRRPPDHGRMSLDLLRAGLILAAALLIAALPAQAQSERSAGELMDAVMWNKEPIGGPFALTTIPANPAPTPISAAS